MSVDSGRNESSWRNAISFLFITGASLLVAVLFVYLVSEGLI